MSTQSGSIAIGATRGGAGSCIRKHETCSIQAAIISHVKGLAETKVWSVVADILGLTDRAAKARLAGSRSFTADELAVLLRQERGQELLGAIMGEARPKWWVRFLQQSEIADARTETLRAKRRLQQVLDAVDDTTATIARAETALCVVDEEFHRPHVSALRATARVPDRAMAQATKGRR